MQNILNVFNWAYFYSVFNLEDKIMPLYISMPLSEELIPSFFVPSHP